MKAKELMIGDWVNIPQNNVGIRKIDIGDMSFFTEFSPIPLTAEILEKNAYPNDGCWYSFGDFYVAHYGDCYVIHQNPDEDKRDFLCIIYNVHELQHALRLCGMNKLADNFKV